MSNYRQNIQTRTQLDSTFKAICDYNVQQFPNDGYAKYYSQLCNGTAILETAEQLNAYMACYSDMHVTKLNLAFDSLFNKANFDDSNIEVIDWGCGQAFASCTLIDHIKENQIKTHVSKFTLIEPSSVALERGVIHVDALNQFNPKPIINAINQKADSANLSNQIWASDKPKIHMFSNILDVQPLNLDVVFNNVINNFNGDNYFVCVSPVGGNRLKEFYERFSNPTLISQQSNRICTEVFRPSAMKKISRNISRIEYVFKVQL
jgi:hypothetical protein